MSIPDTYDGLAYEPGDPKSPGYFDDLTDRAEDEP